MKVLHLEYFTIRKQPWRPYFFKDSEKTKVLLLVTWSGHSIKCDIPWHIHVALSFVGHFLAVEDLPRSRIDKLDKLYTDNFATLA